MPFICLSLAFEASPQEREPLNRSLPRSPNPVLHVSTTRPSFRTLSWFSGALIAFVSGIPSADFRTPPTQALPLCFVSRLGPPRCRDFPAASLPALRYVSTYNMEPLFSPARDSCRRCYSLRRSAPCYVPFFAVRGQMKPIPHARYSQALIAPVCLSSCSASSVVFLGHDSADTFSFSHQTLPG